MWKFKKFRLMEQAGGEGAEGGAGGEANKGGAGGAGGGSGGDGGSGAGGGKPSDAEAKLLKESMARKAKIDELEKKLKSYEGVDPEEFKKLKEAEATAAEARKAAEKAELEKRGEFDRLKQQMIAEHENAMKALRDEIAAAKAADAAKHGQIVELTIGQAFANSKFITDELTLTPRKTRSVYGDHFEVKDGAVVAYDKPAGASNRTVLVDGRGEPLSFEEAIKKLVEADPDRDSMLKSKLKAGSGASGGGAGAGGTPKGGAGEGNKPTDSLSRIRTGLGKSFKSLV
jgi:hypothetical protein